MAGDKTKILNELGDPARIIPAAKPFNFLNNNQIFLDSPGLNKTKLNESGDNILASNNFGANSFTENDSGTMTQTTKANGENNIIRNAAGLKTLATRIIGENMVAMKALGESTSADKRVGAKSLKVFKVMDFWRLKIFTVKSRRMEKECRVP